MTSLKAFIAYSHKDKEIVEKFRAHMSVFQRVDMIEVWYDGEILPGAHWDQEISDKLSSADIVFPMISIDFIQSNYCYETELRKAEEREKRGLCRIIPIYVRSCYYKPLGFSQNQMLPNGDTPLASLDAHKLDDVLTQISQKLHTVIDVMQKLKKTPNTRMLSSEELYPYILECTMLFSSDHPCSYIRSQIRNRFPDLSNANINDAIHHLEDLGYITTTEIPNYSHKECKLYCTPKGRDFLRRAKPHSQYT